MIVARSIAISALSVSAANAFGYPELEVFPRPEALDDIKKLPQIELLTVIQAEDPSLRLMEDFKAQGWLESVNKSPAITSGKVKLLLTGLTAVDKGCYHAPPASFPDPKSFNSSFNTLLDFLKEKNNNISARSELPALQSALLAITDKDHVGFSDSKKFPKVNRIVLLATDSASLFVPSGSTLIGDGSDTCASGPPDAAILAKILQERDVILVVFAIGDDVVSAWKSYGSALTGEARNLYHVISTFDFHDWTPDEQMWAAVDMVKQADVQALVKYLKSRFESQGAEMPGMMMPTPAPNGTHTGAAIRIRSVDSFVTTIAAASLVTLR